VARSKTSVTERSISGSDFLQLDVSGAPARGRADWLTEQIRAAIGDGRLSVGSRLPATRVLADELRLARGVVTEAYRRLIEDGQVAGYGRAGTIVVAVPAAAPDGRADAGTQSPPSPEELFAPRPSSEVFDLMRAVPARIDLSPGVPDLAAFPRSAWLRAERSVLADVETSYLGYGDPGGALPLRRAVATWLARNRGVNAAPEEIIVVAGVAQSLALLARVLRGDGITQVAVEDPGSLGTRQQLQAWQVTTPPVPVDAAGIRVDELSASAAPAVLLTPAHQFPTGVVLDGARRRELMQWVDEGGLIIEDDYDAEHRYDRPPVPALRALRVDRILYTGSVSKLLSPALRIGWLLPPPAYREAVVAAKRDADLGNAVLPQLVLAELMRSGALESHLRLTRARHRRRRDAMLHAVHNYLPHAQIHGAAAGLHLMLTLDTRITDVELAAAALARGVKVHPLSWHSQRAIRPGLVLGYAARTPDEITEGAATIAKLLRRTTARSQPKTRPSPAFAHGARLRRNSNSR
jgi:GntR family transcriptional regulator / MocR family aminotransferase